MSETIYARVPQRVKRATEEHAAAHGMTLANAVSDLLDRGLQAVADAASVAELERRIAALSAETEALRQRDLAVSSAYRALADRTAQPVGSCPSCGASISGHDLLVAGRCPAPECRAGLTALLGATPTPAAKGGVDDAQLKILLGALGLLLGIAFISQQPGRG